LWVLLARINIPPGLTPHLASVAPRHTRGTPASKSDTVLTQPSLRPSERFVYLTIYIAARDADVVQSRIAQALKLASLACPPLPIRDAESEMMPTE
jgi:hypothetical protein